MSFIVSTHIRPLSARIVWTLLVVAGSIAIGGSTAQASIFNIGNSLTWDTLPPNMGDAEWDIFCSKNLSYIYNNPEGYCDPNSIPWTTALANNRYDYVTVQPFNGTTLAQDVSIISEWMEMQPNATFVLHTGWQTPTQHVSAYETTSTTSFSPSDAYFTALENELRALHPDRRIKRSQAAKVLYDINLDIQAENSPITDVSYLYRDQFHMSYTDGRYLMHNIMRLAVDKPLALTPDEEASPERQYLNEKLRAVAELEELPGDFNDDGVVNLADYVVWRNALGSGFNLYGNGDEQGESAGVVDEADYMYWKQHFGDVSPTQGLAGHGTQAVPEPGALVLSGLGVVGTGILLRSRCA